MTGSTAMREKNVLVLKKVHKVLHPCEGNERKTMEKLSQRTSDTVAQERSMYSRNVIEAVAPVIDRARALEGSPRPEKSKSAEARATATVLARIEWDPRPERRPTPAVVADLAQRLFFLRPGERWDELVAAAWRPRPDVRVLGDALRTELSTRLPDEDRIACATIVAALEQVATEEDSLKRKVAHLVGLPIKEGERAVALCRALCGPSWKRALGQVAVDQRCLGELGLDPDRADQVLAHVDQMALYGDLVDFKIGGIDRLAKVAFEGAVVRDLPKQKVVDVPGWRLEGPRSDEDLADRVERDRVERDRCEREEQMRAKLFGISTAVRRAMLKDNADYAAVLDDADLKGLKPTGEGLHRARTRRRKFLAAHGVVRGKLFAEEEARLGARHVVADGVLDDLPQMEDEIVGLRESEGSLAESLGRRHDDAGWNAVGEELAAIRPVRSKARSELRREEVFPLYEWGLVPPRKDMPEELYRPQKQGVKKERKEPLDHAMESGRVILASGSNFMLIDPDATIELMKEDLDGKRSKPLDRLAGALSEEGGGEWLYFPKGGVGV